MTDFEIYSLILCLIVFIMLVSVFSFLIVSLVKLWFAHIKAGLDDENIVKELKKEEIKPKKKVFEIIGNIFNISFSTVAPPIPESKTPILLFLYNFIPSILEY